MGIIIQTIQKAMARAGYTAELELSIAPTGELAVMGTKADLDLFQTFQIDHMAEELDWAGHAPADGGLPPVDYYTVR